MMRLRNTLLAGVLVLLFLPATAGADWIVAPFIGTNWGSNSTDENRLPFGASIAYMTGGIIGLETQISFTNNFFGDEDLFGSNSVLSWMGNAIVGIPIGGYAQLRPYASGGVGLLRSRVGGDAGDLFDITTNDFGFNVGAGLMGFFTPNVGIRGDVRYYRSLTGDDNAPFAAEPGRFHFWQGTVGVAFRF